jgi:HAD superfamily hydrolase (TIGR01549 family)
MINERALNFIDRHEVVILDLCNTFLFVCDRFSDSKSFSDTYRNMGGARLADQQVESMIERTFSILERTGDKPEYYDKFPQVKEIMHGLARELHVSEEEIGRLEEVFAIHESGTIPKEYADVLVGLRKRHRLGLLSNIWTKKNIYVEELRRAGVDRLFENTVFSSDHGMLKPSRKLFDIAVEPFKVDRSKIVYIGDSYDRDVVGAKQSGLSSVWISYGKPCPQGSPHRPDQIVDDLRDLASEPKK